MRAPSLTKLTPCPEQPTQDKTRNNTIKQGKNSFFAKLKDIFCQTTRTVTIGANEKRNLGMVQSS
jgi:hypothetical protein